MASSVWKGYISFGLISAPIRLFAAARYSHITFHEIHRKCGTRVHQQLYCPYDEQVVSRDEIAMGYEVAKDKYVLVDREELKKIQPASSTVMEILQFVKLSDVDPIYFETSYFAVPDESGQRAYTLLTRTMQDKKYAAIAKVTLHQRERTVIIRPYQDGLTLHTLYYPSEIHKVKEYGHTGKGDFKQQEIALAEQLAEALVKPFHPEEFHDEYQERVMQLIESKEKGGSGPQREKAKHRAPVIDLMEALKKSLQEKKALGHKAKSAKTRKTA